MAISTQKCFGDPKWRFLCRSSSTRSIATDSLHSTQSSAKQKHDMLGSGSLHSPRAPHDVFRHSPLPCASRSRVDSKESLIDESVSSKTSDNTECRRSMHSQSAVVGERAANTSICSTLHEVPPASGSNDAASCSPMPTVVSISSQKSLGGPNWRILDRTVSMDNVLSGPIPSTSSRKKTQSILGSTSLHLPLDSYNVSRHSAGRPGEQNWDNSFAESFNTSFNESFNQSISSIHNEANPPFERQPAVRRTKSAELTPLTNLCPQKYFDSMMKSRGYATKKYTSLNTAYSNKPTALQQASYHPYLFELVRNNQIEEFHQLFSCGISPNPCDEYGESLLHMICRRGGQSSFRFLCILLKAGCNVQVVDRFGRTPLHDACWAVKPCFKTVEELLKRDSSMIFLTDWRGATPLSYVPRKDAHKWLQFLVSVVDDFWPLKKRNAASLGDIEETISELVGQAADSRPLPDPTNALSLEVAAKVASGEITPEEAAEAQAQNYFV